jgi:hypothetical protein
LSKVGFGSSRLAEILPCDLEGAVEALDVFVATLAPAVCGGIGGVAHLELGDDTETKLIHHAIRIAAYNTAQSLARAILTNTSYTRAHGEAHPHPDPHPLAASGDIIPDRDTNTLHVRLDPLPAPRHTAAIAELCRVLNDTNTVYPVTSLTLRYSVKSHRRPHINS